MSRRNSREAKAQRRALSQVKEETRRAKEYQNEVARSTAAIANRVQAIWAFITLMRLFMPGPSPRVPHWISKYDLVLIGLALFVQIQIYLPLLLRGLRAFEREHKLITTGLFRFTRHPMYTLVVIWDFIEHVWYQPLNVGLILSTIGFWGFTALTCYLHEQEILAKFGDEARDYYARTPRVFLLYPLYVRR